MKLFTNTIALACLLVAGSPVLGQQPLDGPRAAPEILPAPQYLGDPGPGGYSTDDVWAAPPVPELPYGFTWEAYQGAEVEHDIYGYQRTNRPPKKTVACHGWFAALGDSVVTFFSYPSASSSQYGHAASCAGPACHHKSAHWHHAPRCAKSCVPGKISYGTRSRSMGCQCQVQPAPAPAPAQTWSAPPQPMPEAYQAPTPAPVVIDDGGLPEGPAAEPQSPSPIIVAPAPRVFLPTESPQTHLPGNLIPRTPRACRETPSRSEQAGSNARRLAEHSL
jgi:hypothetical protein